MDSVAILKAQGWRITAAQAGGVSAEQEGYEIRISQRRIEFDGFAPSEIMGKDGDGETKALFGTVMAALPGKKP